MIAAATHVFWFGMAVAGLGLLWAVFKGLVVWDDCHSAFTVAPTLDFIVFCPVPFAIATWLILDSYGRYPFEGFALIMYGVFLLLFLLIHVGFALHGRPVCRRQVEEFEAEERVRRAGGTHHPADSAERPSR